MSYPLIVLVMSVLSLVWAYVAAKLPCSYNGTVYFLGQFAILGAALLVVWLLP